MDTDMLNLFAKTEIILLHLQQWNWIPTYYFISAPINIKYFINPLDKMNIFVNGGLTFNYLFDWNLTNIREYDYGTDEKVQNQKPYSDSSKKLYLSVQIIAGIRFALSNQFKIFFEPSFQYFISKTENGFPINENLYFGGVQVGVFCALK